MNASYGLVVRSCPWDRTLGKNESVNFQVVALGWNFKDDLKCKANADFDRGIRNRGKKSVVKTSASTQAMPVPCKGQPGDNHEV